MRNVMFGDKYLSVLQIGHMSFDLSSSISTRAIVLEVLSFLIHQSSLYNGGCRTNPEKLSTWSTRVGNFIGRSLVKICYVLRLLLCQLDCWTVGCHCCFLTDVKQKYMKSIWLNMKLWKGCLDAHQVPICLSWVIRLSLFSTFLRLLLRALIKSQGEIPYVTSIPSEIKNGSWIYVWFENF